MINIIIKLFYIITLFFLVSCGFVLQTTSINDDYINQQGINIEFNDPNSTLSTEINRTIEYYSLRRSNESDALTLRIIEDTVIENIFSLSVQNVPIEYEINYKASYQIFLGEHQLMEPQEIILSRVYTFELNNLLGKQREARQIERELAVDISNQIFRHF